MKIVKNKRIGSCVLEGVILPSYDNILGMLNINFYSFEDKTYHVLPTSSAKNLNRMRWKSIKIAADIYQTAGGEQYVKISNFIDLSSKNSIKNRESNKDLRLSLGDLTYTYTFQKDKTVA